MALRQKPLENPQMKGLLSGGLICLRLWLGPDPPPLCSHLILELLAELQGDGKEDQGII